MMPVAFSVEVILWKTKASTKMFLVRTYFKSCYKIFKRNNFLGPTTTKVNSRKQMQKLDLKQNLKKLIFSFFLIFLRKIRELPLQKMINHHD
jgi:hypothetical protein